MESFHDRISLQNSEVNMPEELGRIYKKLLASDVNQDVARRLTERVSEIYARVKDDPEKILHSLLCETVGETYTIKPKKYKTNVVILIGPTGVGKTTTLVKLAGLFAVDHGQKVGIINTDTYRVAAQEQLKTYSNIMKIPLCTVYSPPEMEAALELMKDRDVLLIDTAGKSSYSYDYRKEIEEYLSYCNADEVLLCVSATTNYATSKDLINNYSFCEDYKLVITKCDETNVAGNIINIASYAKKPVAFMTMGQNVPYDIEPLDPEKIAKRILERRKSYGPSADA